METCYAASCANACVPEPFSGAGEGIRTPDPLITNQMLYRLSYASNSEEVTAETRHSPLIPFLTSGTSLKDTIAALDVQRTGE